MNGMFSNSRGLRDLAKYLFFADCVRDHNLDFLGISETGRRDFSQAQLNRLYGGVDFTWVSRHAHERSEGIWLGVRDETMKVLASSVGDFLLNSISITSLMISYGP